MRNRRPIEVGALLALVVLATACEGARETEDKGTAADSPDDAGLGTSGFVSTLSVDPWHMQSGLDGAAVEPAVVVSAGPGGFDEMLPVELHLSVLSTGDPVPAIMSTATEGSGHVHRLTPGAPLPVGWYQLLVSHPVGSRPASFQPEDAASAIVRDAREFETHFHVGSAPRLLAVAACASDDDGLLPKVRFQLSEPVLVPPLLPVQVTANGETASCVVYDPPRPDDPRFGISCTPAPPADADLVVSISEGLVSAASGAPVRDGSGSTQMTLELPPRESQWVSCRTWRETRISSD